MPIYALIGGAAVILFLVQGDSPANAIIGSYDQLTSTDLPAIPLFTLAGFLLAEGHASDRLLRLFRALFGWAPGGTAVVTAMLCRVLHAPDGRIGRDDSRARRTAPAGPSRRRLQRAILAWSAHGRRVSWSSFSAIAAADSLWRRCGGAYRRSLHRRVAAGTLMLGALAALGVREGS